MHGIHAILWALDKLVEIGTVNKEIVALKGQFTNFIHVASQLDLKVRGRDQKSLQAELSIGRIGTATRIVSFGTRQGIEEFELPNNAPEFALASQPVELGYSRT